MGTSLDCQQAPISASDFHSSFDIPVFSVSILTTSTSGLPREKSTWSKNHMILCSVLIGHKRAAFCNLSQNRISILKKLPVALSRSRLQDERLQKVARPFTHATQCDFLIDVISCMKSQVKSCVCKPGFKPTFH